MDPSRHHYLTKCEELDALMRKHLSRKESKCRSVVDQLDNSRYENELLRDKVVMLEEQLRREQGITRSLRAREQESETAERVELRERERRLTTKEGDYATRLRQVEDKEQQLRLFQLEMQALQNELQEKAVAFEQDKETYERGLAVTQKMMAEEKRALAATLAEVEQKQLDASHAAEAVALRRGDLVSFYSAERAYLSFAATEMHDRMVITVDEAAQRNHRVLTFGARLHSAAVEVAACAARDRRLLAEKATILELREREMTAVFRRERDCFNDDRERLELEREGFLLDCQSITRNIREALRSAPSDLESLRYCHDALQRAEGAIASSNSVTGFNSSARES